MRAMLLLLLSIGSAAGAADNPLEIDAATARRLGVVTARVEPQVLAEELHAPGEVAPDAYATALVSARVAAEVVKRHARLGDEVEQGQPLVTLSSLDVAEAQGALIVAAREWQRVKELGADAVSARRYTEAEVARGQALAKLRAYGVGAGDIAAVERRGAARADGEFVLSAPQAGRIATDDFVVGQRVEPGKPLFTLIDERRVWIEAQVAPAAAARVESGATVRVVAHDRTLQGRVVQRAHRALEASRTMPVRIELTNDGDVLHAGELVDTYIATASGAPVLAVPSAAIVQVRGQSVVFRREGDAFAPAPILAGETRGERTIVRHGLEAGEEIAVEGAYALKARLLKAELGEGHGH